MFAVMRRCALAPAAMVLATPFTASGQTPDSTLAMNLTWRTIGPAVVGGRVSDLAVVESDPRIMYVGTATGGVWKTTSHGADWTPLFDDQTTSSIGDVTVAPSNASIVWVGTGEPQNRQSSPWGDGVYRSVDAGRTWTHVGLAETRHISRIIIHPRDASIVYVAAVGHLWGGNAERGVFRTRDAGRTWEKVLYIDEHTGAIDLVMDPTDPNTLFAAMYQRRRTAWGFNGGGPGSGIYRTLDGGGSWTELTEGLPDGEMGRIGLDVYRRDGNIIYASIEAIGDTQGIYASTDRGETWEQRSTTNQRPMYFSQVRVDPNDPERVYLGAVQLWRSADGGRNFSADARTVHPDHHALWIDPDDSYHIVSGNDGGIAVSFDRGDSWRMYDNLPLAQFYEIGADMRDPYWICGGLQDNGTWCGPSNTLSSQGIRNADWRNVSGGDGFYAQIDPTDPRILYVESQNGNFSRFDPVTGERRSIRPVPRPRGPAGADVHDDSVRYRWNWNTPIVISRHDPATLYAGSQVLFRSADRGATWQQISPDLTRAIDRDTLAIMDVTGNRITLARNDGVSAYGTITTISESPHDPQVVYVGADDGSLQVTRDGGASWTRISANLPGLPPRTYVSRVLASRAAPGTVYATFDGHYSNDFAPYVYVSRDYGGAWQRITEGLPSWSVNVIAEHPRNPNLLFAGNEVGVWYSIDAGTRWIRLTDGMARSNGGDGDDGDDGDDDGDDGDDLPTVPVDDILVHPRDNDLILGTHGRGIWILEDLTPLEHLTPAVLASPTHLFPTEPATLWQIRGAQAWVPAEFAAESPEFGALIRYWSGGDGGTVVAEEQNGGSAGPAADAPVANDSVTIEIVDPSGTVIRTLAGASSRGVHELRWDLRLAPAYEPEVEEGGQGGFGGFAARAARGPRVLPGTYHARIRDGDPSMTADVVVRADPRIDVEQADLVVRQQTLLSAFRLAEPLYLADRALDRMSEHVSDGQELVQQNDDAPQSLKDETTAVLADLRRMAQELNRVRQSAGAVGSLENFSGPPTDDQRWQLDRAWEQAPDLVRRINEMMTDRVPALLGRIYQPAAVPPLGDAVPVPVRG